ncbi:MAG TPA: BamA/TamA family outer membrane protein [Flavipsychrobacter sp.]|nr:BamA/TamA family outer membrane protein [Flavipsychrobacter sp.]
MQRCCTQNREGAKFRKVCFSVSLFLCVIFALLFFSIQVSAQRFSVTLHAVDGNNSSLEEIKSPGIFSGSEPAFQFIQQIVPKLQEKGYLSASVDSISISDDTYKVFVFLGKQYRWALVGFNAISNDVMAQSALKKEQWEGRALSPKQVSRVSEKLLLWAENNGYPFARVWLDAVKIDEEGKVTGNFMLDKGALQTIDTIDIQGDIKISRSFLLNYIDLKQKEPYNEKKLRNVSLRLRELPFLQEAAPSVFEFKLSENKLSLFLKEKKSNQLNAIIGLLPNNVETGKFLLTVDALFAFQNILAQGESISLSYQNLQYKSPRLKVDLVYPYLFNTPFGADVHFDLFKKDTTFRRTSLQAGIRYQLSTANYLRVFYHNQSNRLITVDTMFVIFNKRLPDNIDVAANGAGVEIGVNKTDYRISPRKGWEARLTSSALARNVRKSDAITELSDGSGFNYESLYDTLIKRQYQYFINGNLSYYVPVGKRMVFKAAYNGGWVGGENLFRNELYQIGGFRLLRGFDEQSIFTNHYHVATLELRLLLDQNSYFYLFSDNAYVESNFNGFLKNDIYNGFGLGTALETKSGLFTISYALGRSSANAVQFRQSKVHFGYVAYF